VQLGCAAHGAEADDIRGPNVPHAHLIWPGADSDASAVRTAAAKIFASWVREAVYRPGATFTIWKAGDDRDAVEKIFEVAVPVEWGSPVLSAKAAFVRKARRDLRELDARLGLRVGGAAGVENEAGVHSVWVLSDDAARPVARKAAEVRPPTLGERRERFNTAVLCDRSNSGRGLSCKERALTVAYDAWRLRALGVTGGRFSVYLVGTSRDTVRRVFSIAVPLGSPGKQAAVLYAARSELKGLLTPIATPTASAVAEAVDVAVGDLKSEGGDARLVVMSDLRQYTPRRWNFERICPPPAAFLKWIEGNGLRADLSGIPVSVCGFHPLRAPGARAFDGKLAADVRATWEAVFRRMGARALRILPSCDEIPEAVG